MLGLTLWSVYIWTLATPGMRDRNGNLKGTDFLHFYTLGSLALAHRGADLYDMKAQATLAADRVPDAAGIRYLPLYPPQVSLLFAPLAALSYGRALALWWIFSTFVYAACCLSIWRVCPSLKSFEWAVVAAAVAFPPFFHLIAWGQTSAIALACFTTAFLCLRRKKDFLAGIAIGCLIFKPQLGLAAAIVFLSIGAWRVVAGAVLSSAVQLSIGVLYYGFEPFGSWLRTLRNVRGVLTLLEPRPYQTHCLRTFWSMIVPWPDVAFGLYAVSAAIVLIWTILLWKRPSLPLGVRYPSLLLATALVAPHLTVYDLVILAPAFLLTSDWLIAGAPSPTFTRIGVALYLSYTLPLLGPFTHWTHVQLSVLAMSALIFWLGRASKEGGNAKTSIPCGTEMPALRGNA